jgi:DNA-binding FadR family transcriptional regulator
MDWIAKAAKLPGKAVQTALALWWLAGMKPQQKIKISRQALELMNVSDDAYRDALRRLDQAGLINVFRMPGQRPMVEILYVSDQDHATGPSIQHLPPKLGCPD